MKMSFFFSGYGQMFADPPAAVEMMEKQVAEVLEKQLSAELDTVFFEMLVWGAAGAMGAIILAGASFWVWSRIARNKKMCVLLEQLAKNQDRIEASILVIRDRVVTPGGWGRRAKSLQWPQENPRTRPSASLLENERVFCFYSANERSSCSYSC